MSAYYHVPKPNLRHMEIDKYLKLIPELLRQIAGNRLVVFCEDSFIAELFERLGTLNAVDLSIQMVALRDLPAFPAAERLLVSCEAQDLERTGERQYREKGHAHYWALFKGHDPSIYLQNVAIWLSKLAMVARAIELCEPEGDQFVCWADASLAQFAYIRSGWDFARASLSISQVNHYASQMRYKQKTLPLNASYLAATPGLWSLVIPRFYEILDEHLDDVYAHDEETILGLLVKERPEWFHCIGAPYKGPFLRQRYWLNRLFRLGA